MNKFSNVISNSKYRYTSQFILISLLLLLSIISYSRSLQRARMCSSFSLPFSVIIPSLSNQNPHSLTFNAIQSRMMLIFASTRAFMKTTTTMMMMMTIKIAICQTTNGRISQPIQMLRMSFNFNYCINCECYSIICSINALIKLPQYCFILM